MNPGAKVGFALGFLYLFTSGISVATDLGLEVGARMKGNEDSGKPTKPVTQFSLSCRGLDNCTLQMLTLNRCIAWLGNTRVFVPLHQQFSTANKDLQVTQLGPNSIRLDGSFVDPGGTYHIKIILGYGSSLTENQRAKDKDLRDFFDVVTSFSGVVTLIEDNPVDHKTYTYQYEPLVGITVTVPIDCGVMLRGISPGRDNLK